MTVNATVLSWMLHFDKKRKKNQAGWYYMFFESNNSQQERGNVELKIITL